MIEKGLHLSDGAGHGGGAEVQRHVVLAVRVGRAAAVARVVSLGQGAHEELGLGAEAADLEVAVGQLAADLSAAQPPRDGGPRPSPGCH